MREYKFRAWDNGEMHGASFNNLFCNNHHPDGQLIIRSENNPFGREHATVLMQYTGLKDKNGKEIYEGDIVDIDDGDGWHVGRGVIKFGTGSFVINDNDGNGLSLIDGRIETVIGNIYEHPHLLEVTP
jgi:uncharacterized phage protein (TIGR01671 family)